MDLATTDVAAAKSFYAPLFGWEMEDSNTDDGPYTTCRLAGDAVCGLFELSEAARATGTRPQWTSYVSVADAGNAAARAHELGGDVVEDPFDVLDAGRMAILQDPQAAVFAVWEPLTRIGAERVNDIGCLCMNELATTDIEGARSFYEGLFGWTTEAIDMGQDRPIALAKNGEALNASFFAIRDGMSPHWRPCFTVGSTETAMEQVRKLGGTKLTESLDIGHGTIAVACDQEGAVFTLFAGEVDP